jgi:hypothetical protein
MYWFLAINGAIDCRANQATGGMARNGQEVLGEQEKLSEWKFSGDRPQPFLPGYRLWWYSYTRQYSPFVTKSLVWQDLLVNAARVR